MGKRTERETHDDPAWITKKQAIEILQKSERSLDRLVTAGRVQRQRRQRDGMSPEPLFNRADIDALTAVEGFPMQNADQQIAPSRVATDPLPLMAQLALSVLQAQAAPAPAALLAPPRWLSVESAAGYCGLSPRLIKKLISDGRLPALRDGREWKIRRVDLDALDAQTQQPEERKRASSATAATMAQRNGSHS